MGNNNTTQISLLLAMLCLLAMGCTDTGIHHPQADARISTLENEIKDYNSRRHYDSMILVADKLLPLLEADSFAVRRGFVLVQKGDALDVLGKYDSASYYFYDALRIGEAHKDRRLMMKAHNHLGILHFNLGRLDEAVASYGNFLSLARQEKDTTSISVALNNIGNAYMTIGRDFDKAIPYLRECMELSHAAGHNHHYIVSSVNLAQIFIDTGRLDEAQKILDEASQEKGTNYYIDYTEAMLFKARKEYDKALTILEEIMKININTRELYLAMLNEMAEINEERGNLRRAIEIRKQYQTMRDSLHTVERENIIQDTKISYETEKKQYQIEALTKEKHLFFLLSISAGVLILMVIALMLYRTRLHRRQKQLIATQAVLDGETAERTRLARDLHDGLGSMLTGTKLKLEEMKNGAHLDETDYDHYTRAMGMLNESIVELRRVAHHLMPDSLTRSGLKIALTDFCNNFPAIEFDYFGSEERLDPKIEVMVYRIIHELVHNALRHAQASHIMVQVMCEKEYIAIIVRDNGCGFDASVAGKGMGLRNLRDRVASYNGRMEIDSKPGQGTEINVEFKI